MSQANALMLYSQLITFPGENAAAIRVPEPVVGYIDKG